jgi:ubiquitin-conjugating enzyme E2 J2
MMAQLKKATQELNEYIKFATKSDNEPNVWYILLSNFPGDDGEFAGGEYLCRMEAPDDFPFNPPHFYLMTENGVYGVETKVCVSIGEYHKDQYRAALGMAGFAN